MAATWLQTIRKAAAAKYNLYGQVWFCAAGVVSYFHNLWNFFYTLVRYSTLCGILSLMYKLLSFRYLMCVSVFGTVISIRGIRDN